jgi:hypothetical protein
VRAGRDHHPAGAGDGGTATRRARFRRLRPFGFRRRRAVAERVRFAER